MSNVSEKVRQLKQNIMTLDKAIRSCGFTKLELKPLNIEALDFQTIGADNVLTDANKKTEINKILTGLFKGAFMLAFDKVSGEEIPIYFGKHSAYLWGYKDGKVPHKKKDNVTWVQFKKTVQSKDKESNWCNELVNEIEPNVEGIFVLYMAQDDMVQPVAMECFDENTVQGIMQVVNAFSTYFTAIDNLIDVQLNAK